MISRSVIKAFFVGIVLSSVLAFPFILDITLVPRFLGLSVCIGLALYFLYTAEFNIPIKIDSILLFYASYTLFCCISIVWSNTRSESIFESSKQLLGFFVFLFTYFALKKEKDYFLKNILKLQVLLFILSLLIAAYQFSRIQNFNKESLYFITGLSGHKNLFASFLFLNLFFLLSASCTLESHWKTLAIISSVLNIVIIFLLQTKAAWIGLLVTLVVYLILYVFSLRSKNSGPKIKLSLFVIIFAVFINLFFFNFLQPIIQKSIGYTSHIDSSGGKENSNTVKLEEERLILWDKTYHLTKQRPLCGVGMGNWQIHFPDATLTDLWRAEDLNFTFQRPHNDFLWILSETGIIGFNLFLLFLLTLLFSLIRTLRLIPPGKGLATDIILCAAFILGYLTISFFDFPKERIEHTVWINIIFGMAYFYIRVHHPLKIYTSINPTEIKMVGGLILIIGILFTGLMRLNGEFYTRRMLNYKNSNQLLNVIDAGNSAVSFAYSIDPTSVPVCWYTGNAHASLGNYEEAQKDFIKAFKLNPYNRNVLNDLGSSYVFTNYVLSAKKCYEEAARISPRFDDPKLNLAAIHINAKDFKTASAWLNSIFHDSERRSNYQRIVDMEK